MFHPFVLLVFLDLVGLIEAECLLHVTGCPIKLRNHKKIQEINRVNAFFKTRGPIPNTSGPYEFTRPDIYSMLKLHNEYRSFVASGELKERKQAKNMYKLVWDPLLQKSAQEWANKCSIEASNTPNVGENRYVFTDNNMELNLGMIADYAVSEWSDEPDYSPLSEDNKYRAGVDSAVSNYTQLVWGATTKFGCGGCIRFEESGERSTYIICHYQVKGNIDGEYIYQVGEGCTKNENCTTYPGSKCEVSTKLCLTSDYVEEKFF